MENKKAPSIVQELADMVGGTITEVGGPLSDGSGFAIMSMPLPKTHWIYGDGKFNVPPMPFRMGRNDEAIFACQRADSAMPAIMTREEVAERIRDAGRHAVRASTMDGREMDFDPDAMIQNLVVGMLGYWTEDGLCTGDDWANPEGGGGANWKAPKKETSEEILPQDMPTPSQAPPDFEV